MEKKYIHWGYIDTAINHLAKVISESNLYIQAIYGLPRGGLIPAVMLSHKLDIPLILDRDLSNLENENILIIDDICDTGKTLCSYELFKYPTATIHYKPSTIIKPTFYYELVDEDTYIYFPWEREDSDPIADYLKTTK